MIARLLALLTRRRSLRPAPAAATRLVGSVRVVRAVRLVPVRPSKRGALIPIAVPDPAWFDFADCSLAEACGAAIRAERARIVERLEEGRN